MSDFGRRSAPTDYRNTNRKCRMMPLLLEPYRGAGFQPATTAFEPACLSTHSKTKDMSARKRALPPERLLHVTRDNLYTLAHLHLHLPIACSRLASFNQKGV